MKFGKHIEIDALEAAMVIIASVAGAGVVVTLLIAWTKRGCP